jgi:hypothetical protein
LRAGGMDGWGVGWGDKLIYIYIYIYVYIYIYRYEIVCMIFNLSVLIYVCLSYNI